MVQLHRLDCDPETKFRYPSAFRHESRRSTPDCIEIYPRTTNFRCHQERVKDVEVSEAMPNLFWSASEDGTVRQFDVRVEYALKYVFLKFFFRSVTVKQTKKICAMYCSKRNLKMEVDGSDSKALISIPYSRNVFQRDFVAFRAVLI